MLPVVQQTRPLIAALALALAWVGGASAQLPTRWHFAWDTLAAPADLDYLSRQPLRKLVQRWGDGETAGHGHATYYARLLPASGASVEDASDDLLGLIIPEMYSSYRLYANGIEVATCGTVGTSAETQRGLAVVQVARFPRADTVHLVLHVANYLHARGGPRVPMTFGRYDDLLREQLLRYLSAGVLASVYLVAAFVMLASYRLFRDTDLPLWASAVCATMFYRSVAAGEHLLQVVFPAIPYGAAMRAEYLTLFLVGIVYWELVHRMVGRVIPRFLMRAVRAYTAVMIAVVLAAPVATFTGLLPVAQVVILSSVLYMSFLLVRWLRRDPRANVYGALSFGAMAIWAALAIYANASEAEVPTWLLTLVVLVQLSLLFLHVNRGSVLQLLRLRKDAEQGSAAKSTFLATMSHEIRTPMNGVLGMTSLLADTGLTPEQRQYVDTIRVSGQNLVTIINDVLDFSKADAGKMSLELQPVDLCSVLESTAALVSGNARQKGLALEVDLPADWRRVRVEADPTRLSQVVTNLLSNAVKFTDAGAASASAPRATSVTSGSDSGSRSRTRASA